MVTKRPLINYFFVTTLQPITAHDLFIWCFRDALKRSGGMDDGIVLAVGESITLKTCPWKHIQLFQILMSLKSVLCSANLSTDAHNAFRQSLLFDNNITNVTLINFRSKLYALALPLLSLPLLE